MSLPTLQERKEIIKISLDGKHNLTESQFEALALETKGYSSSDLSNLVNEAVMKPIEELNEAKFFKKLKVILIRLNQQSQKILNMLLALKMIQMLFQ